MSKIELIPFLFPREYCEPCHEDADEIVACIEDFYSRSIERPEMYFGSPSQMEAALFELEPFANSLLTMNGNFPAVVILGTADFLRSGGTALAFYG